MFLATLGDSPYRASHAFAAPVTSSTKKGMLSRGQVQPDPHLGGDTQAAPITVHRNPRPHPLAGLPAPFPGDPLALGQPLIQKPAQHAGGIHGLARYRHSPILRAPMPLVHPRALVFDRLEQAESGVRAPATGAPGRSAAC